MNARQHKALMSQDLLYQYWKHYRNSAVPETKQGALAAKCLGTVYWDRIMFPRSKP